jgi:hypothetical protein
MAKDTGERICRQIFPCADQKEKAASKRGLWELFYELSVVRII